MSTAEPTLASAPSGVTVAAFDFDGTLTRGDTLRPYLRRALGWPRWIATLMLCSPWLLRYALGLLDNESAKAHLLQRALAGCSTTRAQRWTRDFLSDHLPLQWRGWTMRRLQAHQRAGHICVLVSASPDLYLEAVARQLGFDALLCTTLEVVDGRYTGRLSSPNCFGPQKVSRLLAWRAERWGTQTPWLLHAYGDSRGDTELLALADYAWLRGTAVKP